MSYYVTHENSVLNINNAHLKVSGNVQTDVLKLGAMEFAPPASDVPGTVNFTNVTTGVTTTSNLNVGGTLQLGTVEVVATTHTLENTTALGNVTSNTIQFTNTTTSLVASGNVEVGTANLFVDTVTGNVGIGTNNPTEGLQIYRDGTDPTYIWTVSNNASKRAGVIFSENPTDKNVFIEYDGTGSGNGNYLAFYSGVSGWVGKGNGLNYIPSTGNVGIGTSGPNEKLDVYGNGIRIHDPAAAPKIDLIRGGSSRNPNTDTFGASDYVDWRITSGPSLKFQQQYTGANSGNLLDVMTLEHNSGHVGIGTTNPENRLHLYDDDANILYLQKSTSTNGVGIKFTDTTAANQFGYLRYYHADSQSFGTGNCFRLSTDQGTETLAIGGSLHIGVDGKDNGDAGNHRKNLFIQSTYGGNTSQNYGWWMGAQDEGLSSTDNDFYFSVVRNGSIKECAAIIDQNNATMNFTGQHRTFVKDTPTKQLDTKEGLIVSADQNEFVKMSGGVAYGKDAITINESLPLVSLSTKSNDKKCFGVLSTTEDPETRKEVHGNIASTMRKEEGDTRVYVNSVGEGAIWVVNTNGTLESGDYITTSNVAGYGMKQDDDILHNYTVAKILMDCDFNPVTQPKRTIRKESRMIDYWIRYGDVKVTEEEYQTLPETKRKLVEDVHYRIDQMEVVKEDPEKDTFVYEQREEMVNVLDEHGEFQWEEIGETEKAYTLRYLDADGNITDEANAVHIAAFVGCTYHCG